MIRFICRYFYADFPPYIHVTSFSFLFSLLLFCITTLSAYTQGPFDWENPKLTGINNEPPHASFLPYPDEISAQKNDWSLTPWSILLNGTWKIKMAANPDNRIPHMFLPIPIRFLCFGEVLKSLKVGKADIYSFVSMP